MEDRNHNETAAATKAALVTAFNTCLEAIAAHVADEGTRFEAQSALATARAIAMGYPYPDARGQFMRGATATRPEAQ